MRSQGKKKEEELNKRVRQRPCSQSRFSTNST